MDEAEVYYRTYAEIDGGGSRAKYPYSRSQGLSASPTDVGASGRSVDPHSQFGRLLRRLVRLTKSS